MNNESLSRDRHRFLCLDYSRTTLHTAIDRYRSYCIFKHKCSKYPLRQYPLKSTVWCGHQPALGKMQCRRDWWLEDRFIESYSPTEDISWLCGNLLSNRIPDSVAWCQCNCIVRKIYGFIDRHSSPTIIIAQGIWRFMNTQRWIKGTLLDAAVDREWVFSQK